MTASSDDISMALFCDFENIALGVRDASYDKFDISKVLERLLLKGQEAVEAAPILFEGHGQFCRAPLEQRGG